MNTKIMVKGMHCNACKMLVKMELEDKDLDNFVESIDVDDEDNKGIILLIDVNEDSLEKIKAVINSMENYSVI